MSWRRVFRARLYIRDSLWALPLAGALFGSLLAIVDIHIDQSVHPGSQLQYSASTASAVLAAIVGATAALTGFVVTVTTLVVQMATGTFSARYMRLWYRDRLLKLLLALLVGTLAFSFSVMRRVETSFVPNLGATVAGVLLILSLLVFLVFLDRYLHRLRPVAVAALVHGYFRRNFEYEVKRAGDPVATDEIREYGAGAIQIMRRLRALLEELQDEVRPEYRAAVTEELVRLDATVKRSWGNSVDFDRDSTADTQGIGGPETQPSRTAAAQSPGAGEADGAGSRFDGTQ